MQPSVKLGLSFDANRLAADLDRIIDEDYIPHFNKGYYAGDWSAVALRSVGGESGKIYPDPTRTSEFADTPVLARCPYVQEILGIMACPLQAVRFLRLAAGSIVKEHRDFRLSLDDGEVRLHVPVRTNDDVLFILGGHRVVMQPGECWYHDFTLPHSVHNAGQADRIHLVMDCVVNDWLRSLITGSATGPTGQP